MKTLPYLVPDRDANLNTALLMLTIYSLSKTSRGRLVLNNEKLLIFMYLLKNPVVMGKVLAQIGKGMVPLRDSELYSVNSISVNLDPLFDSAWVKNLLKQVSARGCLQVDYRKADGFMYSLTKEGEAMVEKLDGEYFDRVRQFLVSLDQIKSESAKNLNQLLNNIFRL